MLVLIRFLPYIAIAVVALVIFYSGYRKGVNVTTMSYETRIMEERVRLTTANETALKEAATREVQLATELRARDETIKTLAEEAAKDPHAHRPSLSAGSVRRIDRIN